MGRSFGFEGYINYSGASLLGAWDANANNPFLQSGVGVNGTYYIVSVAGNTNLDGNNVWNVGDWALFTVGNVWIRIANPNQAYNQIQDEGINLIKRTTLDFTGNLVTASDNGAKTLVDINYSSSAKAYGSFYDTTIQAPAANVQTPMQFNSTDLSNGVSIVNDGLGNPTLITVAKTTVYNIQFSAQLHKTLGAKEEIYIWLRKNGVNVPQTNTAITMANNGHYLVAAWNFFIQLNAGQNAQIMFVTTNGQIHIDTVAVPVLVPPLPSVPSVILTVNEI